MPLPCSVSICCRSLVAIIAIGLSQVGDAIGGEWGDITGRIVLTGKLPPVVDLVAAGDPRLKGCGLTNIVDESLIVDPDSHGIADVFIYIKQIPTVIHPDLVATPKEPLQITIEDCRFTPRTLLLRTGQQVQVESNDPIPHQPQLFYLKNRQRGGSIILDEEAPTPLPGTPAEQTEPLPTRLSCSTQPYMEGWCLVSDHPYNAITDTDGSFRIDKLPAGEQTLTIWHSRTGYIVKELKVSVPPSGVIELGDIEVAVERFAESR